ncbi:MAG: hypothetical protein ABR511_12130 [Acidimicrobiales bacterium]
MTGVLLVTLVVAACGGGGGGSSARLTVDGKAEVTAGGGSTTTLSGSRALHTGDSVRVTSGSAQVRLDGGRQLELRATTQVAFGAGGSTGLHPALGAGALLVTAPEGVTTSVTAGDVEVAVSGGSAKVTRGLSVTVAAYSGGASVASAGRSVNVAALRQVTVAAAGVVPNRPIPLSYDPKDGWDQRFLGDAIELGTQLVARSRGFTGQLRPDEGHTPGFYRQILPALAQEPAFVDLSPVGADRAPGEILVGLAIAVQGRRETFADRVREVFSFHDEGAAWGLVVQDQGVDRAPLLSGIDDALGRQPAASAAAAPPTSSSSPSSSRRTTATTVPASRAPGSTIRSNVPTTTPTATNPPAAVGPADTGVPLIDNTVNSLVNLLSGLLGGPGRG